MKADRVHTSKRGGNYNIMLRTLNILYILLKVLMLTKTAIAFSDCLENLEASVFPSFKIINVNDYISLSTESDQNFDIVTVRNEVALQEGTTPSPKDIPSQPRCPRAFVEFGNKLNKTDIFVTFRWNEPEFTNGMIQKYRIQYWFENLNQTIQSNVNITPNMLLQCKVYDLKSDTMYYFRVQAHNEVGAGPYTKFINVSTTNENPVPLLLVTAIEEWHILDRDLQIDIELHKYDDYNEIVYSALEHKFYGITFLTMELITWEFNTSAIATKPNFVKILDFENFASYLCIDWVARNLYWVNFSDTIMKLDLTLLQMGIVKYNQIGKTYPSVSSLNVLPSKGYLYWIKHNFKMSFIMQSDLDEKNMKPLLKNGNECSCSYEKPISFIHTLQFDMNTDIPLIYWIQNDSLIAAANYGCGCKSVFSAENQTELNYLVIDKKNIYLYSANKKLIYILNKKYAVPESKEKEYKLVQKVPITYLSNMLSLDQSLQPYPETKCLTPNMTDYHVKEELITENSIVVKLPEPVLKYGCEKYNLATTIYTISMNYLTCLDNDLNKSKELNVQTGERHYKFQNLTPFTEYTLKLALSNFYFDKLSISLQFGADVKLTTTGKLNAPENVTVQVLTPTLATVYWIPPKNLSCVTVNYEVHWKPVLLPNSTRKITSQYDKIDQPERTRDGKFFTTIQSLLPGLKYFIYVRVYPTNFINFFTDSSNKSIYMYSEPNNLNLSGVSTNSMNISWIYSVNLTIHYKLEYKNGAMREWQIAYNTEVNNGTVTYYIENLLPRTKYKYRLILRYPKHIEDFIWPSDGEEFTFETLGNVPGAPGRPTITRLSNFTYQLNWEPAQAHDSQVTLYRLEGLIDENNYKEGNQTDKNEHWNLYYNGTDNYWIITGDMNQKYLFRVQAKNVYGFGEWSESSAVVDLTESMEISPVQYYLPLILSIVVTFVLICLLLLLFIRQRQASKEIVLPSIITDIESPTLYKTPSGNVQPNAVYDAKSKYNLDEFALTIIEKKQIILGKLYLEGLCIGEFLGSGAFGKVFQGIVKNFEGSDTTPVAIKTLRENATSREKIEFLEEAKLMSDLRHKHVLRLLGICLDADSPWLILELMEAGDLLKYLKENRTLLPSNRHALSLQDLLAMCEDVARGCCYLEEQHFVHRDLACRNCLISARNRKNRIVKIGDFGLARDIYKDDYYRMEGETPLPVRWMAPESLKYRKFTSKSDVWAFGVLMWEITSLGQQPYYARNNIEVCIYVCAGGKLSKPLNCPSELYQLMLSCWNAMNRRPKFKHCLENIVTLKDNIEDAMLNSVDIIRRVQLPPSKIPEYLQMEDLVESTANHISERLTGDDASNDVIEPLT